MFILEGIGKETDWDLNTKGTEEEGRGIKEEGIIFNQREEGIIFN